MLSKKYDSMRKVCRVTFVLPYTRTCSCVAVVGDFNNWDRYANPMHRDADGAWRAELRLEAGRDYHYRFIVDNKVWIVDRDADRFAVHPQGGENSVLAA